MKYIRTKDGVFENKPLERKWGGKGRGGYTIERKDSDIINQADTIEELCDEFVLYAEDYGYFSSKIIHRHWVFDDTEEAKEQIRIIGKGMKRIIYGAIWTDKGLIYVAKMNDKGELELL